MAEQMQRLELDFAFVEAVDKLELTERELALYSEAAALWDNGRRMGRGEIACALSHATMWQRIVTDGHDEVLELEDDVRLGDGLKGALANRSRLPGASTRSRSKGCQVGGARGDERQAHLDTALPQPAHQRCAVTASAAVPVAEGLGLEEELHAACRSRRASYRRCNGGVRWPSSQARKVGRRGCRRQACRRS